MTFIISEDMALKQRLQGMQVFDGDKPSRTVGVWFGQPDKEMRVQDYPYVVINLIDISEATERVHSANPVRLSYLNDPILTPTSVNLTASSRLVTQASVATVDPEAHLGARADLAGNVEVDAVHVLWDRPLPVNIDYQVSSYSRHPRHDRLLLNQLLQRLPMRGGLIGVEHDKPGEGTARRLDFLGLTKRDRIEDNKRVFVNDLTVRISSEMDPDRYMILARQPGGLSINVGVTGQVNPPQTSVSPWGPNPGPPSAEDANVPTFVEDGVVDWTVNFTT